MMQSNCPSLSPNTIYRLATHSAMGLDYCGVGKMFMNTCSLLLCFHSKPSFVMHDESVILSHKFADILVICQLH